MSDEKTTTDLVRLPASTATWPEWVKVPPDFNPPKGRPIMPIRFRAAWTDTPSKGDRQCIVWTLSDLDEKVAMGRAMNDPTRLAGEFSKIMVRSFDGIAFRQDGTMDGEFAQWWGEIGHKCRDMLWKLYLQLHRLSDEERSDFFGNCLGVVVLGE